METIIASEKLFALFLLYKSRPFVFVEPGGNFGDALICRGANKLAEAARISCQEVNFVEFMKTRYPPEAVVYIHGGGGINQFWSGRAIKALQKAIRHHPGPVILGPQTFQTDENFLDRFATELFSEVMPENIFLFFREDHSFKSFKQKAPAAVNLFVDHDTALNLKKEDLPETRTRHTDILYCIRSDKEMNPDQEYNILSKWIDPIKCSRTFEEWLALHAMAGEIITNRLHSAILGLILGIPVTLLPNNYHKNRAVWEFSLRKRGVKWSDRIHVNHFNVHLNHIGAVRKIRHSKTFQRMLRQILA